MSTMQTRTADSKGRVTLGERFANRTVLIEDVDETEVRVTLARVIPERELWLHQSAKARDLLMKGVQEAAAGQVADAPDMKRARRLAERIPDDADA